MEPIQELETSPQTAPFETPAGLGSLLPLRQEDVDTIAKSIAFSVQDMLLNGFDAVSHADLGARVELLLGAMPSARTLVLGMQFALMEEDFMLAMEHALLIVERETELMELARKTAEG